MPTRPAKIRDRLRRNGATSEEIEFLLNEERVELNAMTSDVFIQFIEGKLEEHEVTKVIPAKDRLAEAFKLFLFERTDKRSGQGDDQGAGV
jgi:hypothetical protein